MNVKRWINPGLNYCDMEEGVGDMAETYVLASDYDALAARHQEALRALYFWLPHVPAEDSAFADRVAKDAMLLTGIDGEMKALDAEQIGWIQRCSEIGEGSP